MALDILTVAPISDKPEKQFSDTGMIVTNRRIRLRSDTISYSNHISKELDEAGCDELDQRWHESADDEHWR